ncbi:MAG: 30S ribosomal protein S13 [Candidatus Lindowbacteria bacterium]|nr:30S ribosomal protein S13 [Candidatus Lindowbacteria bacterium]
MARIAGVDLPNQKRIDIALTYIYGIGRNISLKIVADAKIEGSRKVKELTDLDIASLRDVIDRNFRVEGDLRGDIQRNIKRLMDIGCYRGLRHKRGLPVRGQNTKNNSRTRKGRKKSVGGAKR